MWPRFGIKVGNSTLCIAHVKNANAKPDVIANKQGDRNSSACIFWNGDDEIEYGTTAKHKVCVRPKQGVTNNLQLLKPSEELTVSYLDSIRKSIPCEYDDSCHKFKLKSIKLNDGSNGKDVELSKDISAYEVQMRLFRAELELARQYHSGDNQQMPIAVLSIPSYYSAEARILLAQCATEAGFHVAQIIDEPSASLLAYAIGETTAITATTTTNQNNTNGITKPGNNVECVLVIKCGGLYSNFELYRIENGLYTKMDSYGPHRIGGEQIIDALLEFISKEFYQKYKLDPMENRRSVAKMRQAAENSINVLSTLPSTRLYIDSLLDGVDFSMQITRARLENIIQETTNNFTKILDDVIQQVTKLHDTTTAAAAAEVTTDAHHLIDGVILIGATIQIPKLQALICSRFPTARIYNNIAPDEVVAIGCARQSIFLEDPAKQILDIYEELNFAMEKVDMWHGCVDDDSDAQVLVQPGDILPKNITLRITLKNEFKDVGIFHIRTGNRLQKVCLEMLESNISKEGNVNLEANIFLPSNDNSPLIVLKIV